MTGRLEACIRLAKKVGIKNRSLLDVGCSIGWFCKAAVEEKAKLVCAIEPSEDKLEIAKKNNPSATIKQGFADKLDFPKSKFDLVTLFDVIEHIPKDTEPGTLSEINRVLKPKGHLIISTPFQNFWSNVADPAWYFGHRHYSKERLNKLLKDAGFKITHTETHGGIWEIIAVWVLYFTKWVLGIKMPFEEWFDVRRRKEYKEPGNVAIMVIAQKI